MLLSGKRLTVAVLVSFGDMGFLRYVVGVGKFLSLVLGATELPRKLDRITDVLIRCILLDGN